MGAAMRVLIIDDDATFRREAMALTVGWGHEVRALSGGAAAAGASEVFDPEVVLANWMLPDVDGWRLCRDLRWDVWSRAYRILVVGGVLRGGETNALVLRSGVQAVLTKPLDPAGLKAELLTASLLSLSWDRSVRLEFTRSPGRLPDAPDGNRIPAFLKRRLE